MAGGVPQIELIKELKTRGYFTILADYYQNPVARNYADVFYRISTLDLAAIREMAVAEKIDMIITCCTDQALATVSVIAEELKLPCYVDASTGISVTNKKIMKRIFHEHNIPTASFEIVGSYEDCKVTKFPVVVKPVDCNSSKGVVKVSNEMELKGAIENAVRLSRTNTAIVESYIDGKELSVDLFVLGGVANILSISVSEKIKNKHQFVIFKGQYPADISEKVYDKINDVAQKIVCAFKLQNCPMLVQLLVKDEDIFVVEFSARTGGCIKYRMIELASGVNIIQKTVDLFEGKIPKIEVCQSEKYIVDEFIYCSKGVFDHIDGIDKCLSEDWIKEVYLLKNKGELLEEIQSSGDRIAAIVYVADNVSDYMEKHNHVIDNIRVIANDGSDIMRHDLLPAF